MLSTFLNDLMLFIKYILYKRANFSAFYYDNFVSLAIYLWRWRDEYWLMLKRLRLYSDNPPKNEDQSIVICLIVHWFFLLRNHRIETSFRELQINDWLAKISSQTSCWWFTIHQICPIIDGFYIREIFSRNNLENIPRVRRMY